MGFEPDGDHNFKSLILASEVDGKLSCVGEVSSGMPQDVRDELNQRLRKLERATPFVPNQFDGVWVQPKLMCRISAADWTSSKHLADPVFQQILADVPDTR